METQCKSCGSVKFEYKEGRKVCAYCGREVINNDLSNISYENTLEQIKLHGYLYTILNSNRTILQTKH